MKEKTFYGKRMSDLQPNELQLLSVDIQLTSLIQRGINAIPQISLAMKLRTKMQNECINMGGEYSREDFLSENGFKPDSEYVPMEDVKEFSCMVTDLEKHLRGGF